MKKAESTKYSTRQRIQKKIKKSKALCSFANIYMQGETGEQGHLLLPKNLRQLRSYRNISHTN